MISLNDSLSTAAGMLGLGATLVPASSSAYAPSLPDAPLSQGGAGLAPEGTEAEDPFFLAVAAALREAGYLDS